MQSDPIVIVSFARTPIGSLQGVFGKTPAYALGQQAIKASVERSGLKPEQIDQVLMGCVLPAGQGQAPARQACLNAGLPKSTGCTTINKMCGSGMQTMILAHDGLLAGSYDIAIAGGMESMSLAPYLLPNARVGYRMGHQQVCDHMFLDGLEDAYERGTLMGVFAERTASKYSISRKEQDDFALTSLARAQTAIDEGYFKSEITPFTVKTRKEDIQVETDELPSKARPDKIPTLKPAFAKEGTVTAANSSAISDGAAATVLMRESKAKALGLTIVAKIVAHSTHSHAPEEFTTAPIGAVQSLLQKANWSVDDVDLFEINEAFAVVTLAAMKELKLNHDKVNIHGGACALGHPIGASGTRIVCTLLAALKQYGKQRGVASLCIGGGEATALAVELVN